jgi:hypothetical protein
VQQVLEQRLKLHLSPEKTKVTSYGKGYSFLGFVLSSRSRRMRPKSVKKFKDKIRELTCRKHNLDKAQVDQLNRVIRGTARYFATGFFTGRTAFNRLDCWIVSFRQRCAVSVEECQRHKDCLIEGLRDQRIIRSAGVWRLNQAEALLSTAMQRKNKDEFRGARGSVAKAISSVSAGGVAQIDPVGGAIAGSLKA